MAGILGDDPRHLEPYIRETAAKYGVNTDIAMRVARSEGLRNPTGDNGKSFGAFQLYTGGGLGNNFIKQGGNINDERATIDYALQQAAQQGWGPWMGAQKQGITGFMGISPQGNQPQMAGLLTPGSTGEQNTPPARPAAPVPSAQPNTLSMNSPLAGMTTPNASAAPSGMHSNQAINEALMNAFRPVVPDQVNSLLGPAIGQIQAHTNPIAFYQPRQPAPVVTRRSS
jgi:hypothetical protein